MKFLVGCAIALLVAGCADVASLAQSLNERQVTSCVWAMGSYGPFIAVNTITATGGATLEQCKQLR